MPLDRRSFLRSLGAGSAALTLPLVHGRGREAWTAEPGRHGAALPASPIRLDSNENPLGPAPEALRAMTEWFHEAGRYPDLFYDGLYEAVGRYVNVGRENILFGSGSGEILKVATEAFVTRGRGLVTAAPTFETPTRRATTLGLPLREVPVDAALKLDLDAMAAAAGSGGLVFLCNPNNPTGTVHGATELRDAIGRMLRRSSQVVILVDEAYHEYVDDPAYATMIPLALEHPQVIVSRTFSKAFGMAGIRLGYAVGRKETLERMAPHLIPNNVNQLVGAAAVASLKLPASHLARERERNVQTRRFAMEFFLSRGYTVADSRANFIMVNIRRELQGFRDGCRDHGVLVGRPFPPLTTWARISIGTMEEMRAATAVFARMV